MEAKELILGYISLRKREKPWGLNNSQTPESQRVRKMDAVSKRKHC